MLADARELEADCRTRVRGGQNGEVFVFGEEGSFGYAFFAYDVVSLEAFATGVAEEVFFPGGDAAVRAEELGLLLWEVTETEFLIGHGKH